MSLCVFDVLIKFFSISRLQASITLPSSVFATDFEEEVGLLNKAAPVSGEPAHLRQDLIKGIVYPDIKKLLSFIYPHLI